MLDKMGGIWAPRPSTGPHKLRESLPLVVILRNRLKYALSRREVQLICMDKQVQVDGRVRTDPRFPAGFMDVVEMQKSGDVFRLLYDTKGRFVLHRVDKEEASYKLARVKRQEFTSSAVPYIVTHDGRTIRYHDPAIKVLDTVKVDIATGKVVGHLKFEIGATVMITGGRNTGRVGTLVARDRHPGSFDIVHVRDAAGQQFATRLGNLFVIGTGGSAWVSLPKGEGIKKSITHGRAAEE